jgi:LEA14-like dessication related protein
MRKNVIGYLAGAGALFLIGRFILRKSEAVKSVNVNVTKVDFNRQDMTFVVFVRIINPSNADLKIQSIVGDVFWKGTAGAVLDYRNPIVVKSLESVTIQVPVKLNLELVTLVSDLLSGKYKDILSGKFEINGSINAEGLVFPFNYSQIINLI